MTPKIRFAVAVSALPVPRSFVGNIFTLLVVVIIPTLGLIFTHLWCISIEHCIHYVREEAKCTIPA